MDIYAEKLLQPIASADIRMKHEVIPTDMLYARQSGKRRKAAGHDVDDTIGQSCIIAMSDKLQSGEVALQGYRVLRPALHSLQLQIIHTITAVRRLHLKVFYRYRAVRRVQVFPTDIGRNFHAKARRGIQTRQFQSLRVEMRNTGRDVCFGHTPHITETSVDLQLTVGVVYTELPIETQLPVALSYDGIKVDIAIGVAVVIDMTDRSLRLDLQELLLHLAVY